MAYQHWNFIISSLFDEGDVINPHERISNLIAIMKEVYRWFPITSSVAMLIWWIKRKYWHWSFIVPLRNISVHQLFGKSYDIHVFTFTLQLTAGHTYMISCPLKKKIIFIILYDYANITNSVFTMIFLDMYSTAFIITSWFACYVIRQLESQPKGKIILAESLKWVTKPKRLALFSFFFF